MIDYKSEYKVGGCLPQPKDKRDWKFGKYVKPLMAIRLPDNFESKIPNDFIYDQGKSSECCACAYSSIRLIQEYSQSGLKEPLSPSFTYANRQEGQYEGEGMMLRDACKQGKYGSILWSEFPNFYSYYEAKRIFNNNKEYYLNHAYPFRINSFYTAHTDEEIMTAIYLTKAVLIGINVTEEFYYPNSQGIIKYPKNFIMNSDGGHALAIIGWKTINNEKYWIVLNSWGKHWGDKGKCYIKFTDMKKVIMDDAYVLVDEINEIQIEKYKKLYNIVGNHNIINTFKMRLKAFLNSFKY